MPAQPPPPTPAQEPDQQAADTQYYRAVLHELIEIGMTIARTVAAQPAPQAQDATPVGRTSEAPCATAAPHATPASPASIAFDRIARAIRRTVLLAQRLAEPPRAPKPGPACTVSRTAARTRILREVEDAIDRRAFRTRPGNTIDTDALHAELHERLDSPDLDDDIADRPIAEIIAAIIQDLGINWEPPGVCPSRRRTPQDIAALHTRAAAPIGAAPPTPHRPALVGRISEAPSATSPATSPAPATMVPIPDDPPPDLAAMLALCAQLVQDG